MRPRFDDIGPPGAGDDAGDGSVLFNEAPSARWFVYRQRTPLDPSIEWSLWEDVRGGVEDAGGDLPALLKRNHARAVVAILEQTDWTGRGVHHCGVSPYPRRGAYVLVYAVRAEAGAGAAGGTTYYASPIPLAWMSGPPAVAP